MKTVLIRVMSPLRFAVIGAFSCAIATLVAEQFLQSTMLPRDTGNEISPLVIALLIDTSGSMQGEKITEVKDASIRFISTLERENTYIAIIPFSSTATLLEPVLAPSQNPARLIQQIQEIDALGGTGMAFALEVAREAFTELEAPDKAVLLFTDGQPNDSIATILQAEVLRREDTVIVAVGTADSDIGFLKILTNGEPDKLFTTQLGEYAIAFDKAAQVIVASAFGTASTSQGLIVVTIVAFFLATALLVSENVWGLRGNWWRDLWWMPPMGTAMGFLAAATGENLFEIDVATWALVGLTSGVALGLTDIAKLGTGGWQLSFPHKVLRGALFGLIGGAVGGILFSMVFGNADIETAAGEITALVSRLSGFSLLGFFIGLALKAGEELLKDVWLIGVSKGPYEGKQFIFNKPVISVGRSGNNDINLAREFELGRNEGRFIQIQKVWFYQPITVSAGETAVTVNDTAVFHKTLLSDNTAINFGATGFLFRNRGDSGRELRERNWALAGNEATFNLPRQDRIRIGHSPTCDVVLSDPSVRAHHCTLEFSDQGIRVQGIGNAHIEINDNPMLGEVHAVLQQGDLITLGKVELGLITA